MTTALARIVACPSPQSSVQTTVNVPSLLGVTTTFVPTPGTASFFIRHSGTQKEWMTSSALSFSSTGSFTGSVSCPLVTFASGYVNDQANCCAVTSTTRCCGSIRSTCVRTTPLYTEIA